MMRFSVALAVLVLVARLVAGPLAIAGFLLPWLQGPGVFAGEHYSGFDLVRLAGLLQQLDLPAAQAAALPLARLLLLGIPVAGAWRTLLAPAHRWHWGYPASGAYLVAAGLVVAGIGAGRTGLGIPSPGVVLLLASAVAIVGPQIRLPQMRSTALLTPQRATRPWLPPPG